MEAITTTSIDILDQTFMTSDGRLLFVNYNTFSNDDELIIHLGNTGRFAFKDWTKCRAKMRWFIKELEAVEIVQF